MEQEFRIGGQTYTFWDLNGTVQTINILTSTAVHGKIHQGSGRLASTTSHNREIWLTRADSGEDCVLTVGVDFSVKEGQQLTAVMLRHGNRDRLVYLVNDSMNISRRYLWGALFMAKYRRDFGCCFGLTLPPILAGVLYGLRDIVGPDKDVPFHLAPLSPSRLDPWWYVAPAGLMVLMLGVNAWRRRQVRLRYQEELAKFLNAMNAVHSAKVAGGA